MRVAILTKGEPYGWTRHYIAGFRACGHEVVTFGPNIGAEELRAFQLDHLDPAGSRTDVACDLGPQARLADLLPPGWTPDLVVAVSMAGTPLCPVFDGVPCPRVYLSIDTWQCPRDYVDAIQYDFAFAAQKSFVPRLRAMGARGVEWLPLAANPAEHFPVRVAPRADVSFAGTISLPIHAERLALLERLRTEFSVIGKTALFGPALCALCNSARVTFNHSAVYDVNMRVFEALAMGCPLMTNRQAADNGLLDLFADGEHLAVYDDADSLVAVVRRLVDDDDARRRIAWQGQRAVLAAHTYAHRAETIVQAVAARVPGFPHGAPAHAGPFTLAYTVPAGCGTAVVFAAEDAELGWLPMRTPRGVARQFVDGADAVLVADCGSVPGPIADTVEKAARCLSDGGTLAVRFSAGDVAAADISADAAHLTQWFGAKGFRVQTARMVVDANGTMDSLIVSARKRSAALIGVVNDAFISLPSNCQTVRESILAWHAEHAPEL